MQTTQQFTGVVPMLICGDGDAEVDFCVRAFGAVELSRRSGPDGIVMHATLRISNALLMVHGEVPSFPSRAPAPDGSSPVVIYLYVEDADLVLERAVAAGARLTQPPMDAPWGDRVGRIVDLQGHVWNVASRPAMTPDAA
jgi:PhnB protein